MGQERGIGVIRFPLVTDCQPAYSAAAKLVTANDFIFHGLPPKGKPDSSSKGFQQRIEKIPRRIYGKLTRSAKIGANESGADFQGQEAISEIV